MTSRDQTTTSDWISAQRYNNGATYTSVTGYVAILAAILDFWRTVVKWRRFIQVLNKSLLLKQKSSSQQELLFHATLVEGYLPHKCVVSVPRSSVHHGDVYMTMQWFIHATVFRVCGFSLILPITFQGSHLKRDLLLFCLFFFPGTLTQSPTTTTTTTVEQVLRPIPCTRTPTTRVPVQGLSLEAPGIRHRAPCTGTTPSMRITLIVTSSTGSGSPRRVTWQEETLGRRGACWDITTPWLEDMTDCDSIANDFVDSLDCLCLFKLDIHVQTVVVHCDWTDNDFQMIRTKVCVFDVQM